MTCRTFAAGSLAVLALTLGGNAFAQEPCGDTTCPKGWECATEPAPCPDMPCAGSDCPVCEGTTVEVCRAKPCLDDADCDESMRCITERRSVCTGGEEKPCAFADGGEPECPEAEPVDCTLEEVSACVPRYYLPCDSAAACGEGFACEPDEVCSCGGSDGSGGGATPPGDAPDAGGAFAPMDGGAAPLPPDDCTCQPTNTNHCVAVKAACTEATAAADCPSGWTCEENPEGVCFSGPDGSGCTPADPPFVCMPPFHDLGGGTRGEDDDGGSSTGGETPVGIPDGGAEPPTTGGAGKSGNAAETGADEPMSGESGGCSVTRPSGASSGTFVGLVLALLGLGLVRRRR
jgi:MYXO-CTERM domain-containing protein